MSLSTYLSVSGSCFDCLSYLVCCNSLQSNLIFTFFLFLLCMFRLSLYLFSFIFFFLCLYLPHFLSFIFPHISIALHPLFLRLESSSCLSSLRLLGGCRSFGLPLCVCRSVEPKLKLKLKPLRRQSRHY